MNSWLEKIHPIRALLAIAAVGATIYMVIAGTVIPDAWWIIVTALALFYVETLTK